MDKRQLTTLNSKAAHKSQLFFYINKKYLVFFLIPMAILNKCDPFIYDVHQRWIRWWKFNINKHGKTYIPSSLRMFWIKLWGIVFAPKFIVVIIFCWDVARQTEKEKEEFSSDYRWTSLALDGIYFLLVYLLCEYTGRSNVFITRLTCFIHPTSNWLHRLFLLKFFDYKKLFRYRKKVLAPCDVIRSNIEYDFSLLITSQWSPTTQTIALQWLREE